MKMHNYVLNRHISNKLGYGEKNILAKTGNILDKKCIFKPLKLYFSLMHIIAFSTNKKLKIKRDILFPLQR